MFQCNVCGSVAPPNTRCNRLVVETRAVDYPRRDRAYGKPRNRRRGGQDRWIPDPGGRGTQVVREIRACELCFVKLAAIERQREQSAAERRAA